MPLDNRLLNPLRDRRSAPQLIAESLRAAIVNGTLQPGEALRQDVLAQHYEVSRIPVREALRRLESEGWVRFLPNIGASVMPLCAEDALEIYEARAALECMLLRLAIPHHSKASLDVVRKLLASIAKLSDAGERTELEKAFYLALYEPARRSRTMDLVSSLMDQGERYQRLGLTNAQRRKEVQAECVSIVAACAKQEVDRACEILERQLLDLGASINDVLSRDPSRGDQIPKPAKA